jgi:hypothetical protein
MFSLALREPKRIISVVFFPILSTELEDSLLLPDKCEEGVNLPQITTCRLKKKKKEYKGGCGILLLYR